LAFEPRFVDLLGLVGDERDIGGVAGDVRRGRRAQVGRARVAGADRVPPRLDDAVGTVGGLVLAGDVAGAG
jgi:hypothetical protein